MIERQKEKFGWKFLFLGANIDAVSTAKGVGFLLTEQLHTRQTQREQE